MAVTITEGTGVDIYSKLNAGTEIQVVKLDVGSGTAIADWGGTVTANVNSGTINVGTVAISNQPAVFTEQPTASALQAQVGMLTGTVSTGSLSNIAMVNAGTVTVTNPTGTTVLISGTPTTNVNSGTINVGTVTVTNPTGTVVEINKGTINLGTTAISSLPSSGTLLNLATGTLANSGTTTGVGVVTSVTNIVGGTLLNSGTTTGVGVVSSLTNGSVNILTGTIQSSGTTTGVGVVSNLTNGSVNLLTGTVTSVTNLAAGTVQVNATPVVSVLTYGTLGTAGGSAFGTISGASGAGTKHYVTNVTISAMTGTVDCYVGFGTGLNGGSVLERGQFIAGGGVGQTYSVPIASGTNSEICYELAGAGTVYFAVKYWKGT